MADPNWFFSTLAQSSAAIVGVTGGLLIQRLLTQRAEILGEMAGVRETVQAEFEQLARRRALAEDVARSLATAGDELTQAAARGDTATALDVRTIFSVMTAPGQIQSTQGTDYTLDVNLAREFKAASETVAEYARQLPADFATFVRILRTNGGLTEGPPWLEKEPRSRAAHAGGGRLITYLQDQVDIARRSWHEDRERAVPVSAKYQRFRAHVVPASFYYLLALLGLLMICGVIAPMFSLEAGGRAARTWLLVTFVPLSLGLLGYIGYEIRQLRQTLGLPDVGP